jgi:regulator of protease activity HflC (stomatin/prohibitin superfamily)
MLIMRRHRIREHERGLWFHDGEFRGVLRPGVHWLLDPLFRGTVQRVSVRDPWLRHPRLDVMVRSGRLGEGVATADLQDHQRALAWVDGRFAAILGPGLHAWWTSFCDVRVVVLDARQVQLQHEQLTRILAADHEEHLEALQVEPGQTGLVFLDGEPQGTLPPGTYAFWTGIHRLRLRVVDQRESTLDVAGQEIMTADRVTLRLNAVVTYRVTDPLRAVTTVDDHAQALYRDAQLALREVIGGRELDQLLAGKEAVAGDLLGALRQRADRLGVEALALGIRDVILPGDMRDLLNQVTEARKTAEAMLIRRREETAAMRSQANTARLLEGSPMLVRMRELEVLEKIASTTNLSVVLGEQGLADRIVKLL